ncbi:hypothetical protein GN958_ATG15737 [Phytophthora infestans]|uniref:Uncharacterized protein n=1 Tax=Phytophthora infestans TaxID=4787 RepID=A0A8S9U6R1_PHYIN|nr:hypothetical protein GN958_ATG15737 [Phytophthora infestans]
MTAIIMLKAVEKKKRTSTDAILEYLEPKLEGQLGRDKRRDRQLDIQEKQLALEEERLKQDSEKTDALMAMMAPQMGFLAMLAEKLDE